MKKTLLGIGVLFLLCGLAVPADALIILDFNSLSSGYYDEGTFSGYFSGVTFDNTGGSQFEVRTNNPGPDFTGNWILNNPYTTAGNATVATFDSPTNFVSVTMGDNNADSDNLYLEAYDSSNGLLDSTMQTIVSSFSGGKTLSVSTSIPSISYVKYYGVGVNNNSVGWDNFSWEGGEGPTVPEPATMSLFGFGLLGAFYKRRKQS